MLNVLIIFGFVALVIIAIAIGVRVQRGDRARQRLFYKPPTPQEPGTAPVSSDEPRGVARWLYLAGYRAPHHVRNFILVTSILFFIGLGTSLLLQQSGIIENLLVMIGANHGGQLDIIAPFFYLAPWAALFILTALPFSFVNTARKKRVASIEQDLPLTLEILSTLVETGLSFDPALARVLESQPPERPLTQELKNFRDENRAGRPRVDSFRRLARRVNVMSLSTFVSAMVQAEQAGGAIGTVLTEQSQDLRKRRRERALEAAAALPIKQLIPLFICFLPGIFVWALGPTMYKLIQFFNIFSHVGA